MMIVWMHLLPAMKNEDSVFSDLTVLTVGFWGISQTPNVQGQATLDLHRQMMHQSLVWQDEAFPFWRLGPPKC